VATTAVQDSVITLSDIFAVAKTAEEKCFEIGGHLVKTSDEHISDAVKYGVESTYLRGIFKIKFCFSCNLLIPFYFLSEECLRYDGQGQKVCSKQAVHTIFLCYNKQ